MCYQSSEACRGAKLKQIASKLFESSLKSFTRNSAWQGPISTSIGRNLFQRNLSSIEDRRRLRCKHYQKLTYKLSILNTLSSPDSYHSNPSAPRNPVPKSCEAGRVPTPKQIASKLYKNSSKKESGETHLTIRDFSLKRPSIGRNLTLTVTNDADCVQTLPPN